MNTFPTLEATQAFVGDRIVLSPVNAVINEKDGRRNLHTILDSKREG